MNTQRLFLLVVAVVAVVAIVGALIVTVGARTPSTALKTFVLDKSESSKWIEVRVLEQTKGKTSLLGDKLIVRILGSTVAYDKDGKKRATKSWLTLVRNDDLVSVLGEYKASDGTIWSDRVVNRSR